MELRHGMIGFSGGNTFMQKAIKFFISSKFSHSFVVVDGPLNIMSALETTDTRVCVSAMHLKLIEKNYVEIWDVTTGSDRKMASAAVVYCEHAGKMYGYLSYLWFMYRWFFRLFGVEKTKMWKWANSGITCSELTSDYVRRLGGEYYQLFNNIDINTVSPRELYKIVCNNPDKFTRVGWLVK